MTGSGIALRVDFHGNPPPRGGGGEESVPYVLGAPAGGGGPERGEAPCQRTPCGQSVNVASERVGKLGTTRLARVVPGLPTLIHPLPTLRRTSAAAG